MLTQDDLKAISAIVGEQIEAKVPPMIKAGINEFVPPTIMNALDSFDERMDLKFDAVQEQLDSIENRMVTKSYFDDKLAHYVPKPF